VSFLSCYCLPILFIALCKINDKSSRGLMRNTRKIVSSITLECNMYVCKFALVFADFIFLSDAFYLYIAFINERSFRVPFGRCEDL
jgi:hypothetical protein